MNTIRMKFSLVAVALLLLAGGMNSIVGQDSETDTVEEIEALLTAQDKCWNQGDIDGFMQTYWKSEKLTFSGGGETTRGWQATLDRYKKSYPREAMGKLSFDHLETSLLGDSAALVLGNWHLDLDGEKKDGNFSLVMKKVNGAWKIVHDHSSTLDPEKGLITLEQVRVLGARLMNIKQEHIVAVPMKHFAIIEADIKIGELSGLSREPLFINRKTGEVTRNRPAEIR